MNVKWIIDPYIFPQKNIPKNIFKELNIEYKTIQYIPFSDNSFEPYDHDECVISYGTINAVRKLKNYYGTYLREENFLCNVYMNNFGNDLALYLNGDHIFVSFKFFKENRDFIYEIFNSNQVFVRPNSGIKSFTGLPIIKKDFDLEINCLENLHAVQDHELLLISSVKKILEESRFIVCNREIVGYSRYHVNGKHKEDLNVSKECCDLGERILDESIWIPEECFTLDLALTPDGPKIIELNSFSCAGWYAADAKNIIKKVSEFTRKIFEEQNV